MSPAQSLASALLQPGSLSRNQSRSPVGSIASGGRRSWPATPTLDVQGSDADAPRTLKRRRQVEPVEPSESSYSLRHRRIKLTRDDSNSIEKEVDSDRKPGRQTDDVTNQDTPVGLGESANGIEDADALPPLVPKRRGRRPYRFRAVTPLESAAETPLPGTPVNGNDGGTAVNTDQEPTKAVRRLPGRRRAPNPDDSIEADLRRQLGLKMGYRSVVKALKPILAELATRDLQRIEAEDEYYQQCVEYETVLADLDSLLERRVSTLRAQFELGIKRIDGDLERGKEYQAQMFRDRCEATREDYLYRALDQLLLMKRNADRAADEDLTDDEGGIVPPLRRAQSFKHPDQLLDPKYDSRSRFFIEIDSIAERKLHQSAYGSKLDQAVKTLGDAVDTELLSRESGIGTMDLSRRDAAINYFNLRSLAEAANAQSQERAERAAEPDTTGFDAILQAVQIRSGEVQIAEIKPPLPSPPHEISKLEARQVMLIKDDRSRRRSQSLDEKRHPAGEYGEAMRIDSVPPLSYTPSRESTLPSSFSAAASFAPDSPESNADGRLTQKKSRGQMQLSHILSDAPAPSAIPNYPPRDGAHSYPHLYSPPSHVDADARAVVDDREGYGEERSNTSHPGRRMTDPNSARVPRDLDQESRFNNDQAKFSSRPRDDAPLEYQPHQPNIEANGYEAEHHNSRMIEPPLSNGSRQRGKGRRIRASTLSALNDDGNQFVHQEPMQSPNSRHHGQPWASLADHIIKQERDAMPDPRRYTAQGQSQYDQAPAPPPQRGYYDRPAESSPPSTYRHYGHSEANYSPYAQHMPQQAWPQHEWRPGPASHRPYETSPQSTTDHYPPRHQYPHHHPPDVSPWRAAAVPHHSLDHSHYADGQAPDQQQGAMGPPQHVEHGYHPSHAPPPPPGLPHGSPPAGFPKMPARQVLESPVNGSTKDEDMVMARSPEKEAVVGAAEQGFGGGRAAGYGGYERREA